MQEPYIHKAFKKEKENYIYTHTRCIYIIYILSHIYSYIWDIYGFYPIYMCVCVYTHTHLEPRNEIGAWGFRGENGN